MTFNTCYKDTGLFGIYLVAENDKLEGAMNVTIENLVRLCHNVSDEVDEDCFVMNCYVLLWCVVVYLVF
jgi:hypothetical protein